MFTSARLKLTAWYLLIIGCISIAFSGVIYEMLSLEIDRFARVQQLRIERQYPGVVVVPDVGEPPVVSALDYDLVAETKGRLTIFLVWINGAILLIAGGLGFVLAGKTLEPIKIMVEEQNQFVSDASHELRTPLTSLKSAMEVNLRDKNMTIKDARTLLTESIEEVNKLQSLSDGLLSLAQFQKPVGQMKLEKIQLAEITTRAINKMSSQAALKNVKITQNEDQIEVMANPYTLPDLLVILLDNAIKYSKPGGVVEVNIRKNDGFAVVSVKDEGIGIEEKDLPHIFDRFYRSDTARLKQDTGGYGLGLAIAKKIVDSHRGSIIVTSKVGVGSVFIVKLPIKTHFS